MKHRKDKWPWMRTTGPQPMVNGNGQQQSKVLHPIAKFACEPSDILVAGH